MKVTLKALRTNFGLTQRQAADKIGVSVDTWRNYENAKSFPDVPVITKIEQEFNTNYNEIIFLPNIAV